MNLKRLLLGVSFVLVSLTGCGPTESEPEGSAPALVQREDKLSYTNLNSLMGAGVATGYTCGANNEVTPSCASSSSASDLSYLWSAPNTGRYTFSAVGSRFNPVIVLTNQSTSTVLTCSYSGGTTSSATTNLTAGQKVFITVDGNYADCGSFQLDIQYADCGTCSTPPSGCYASPGQCVYGVCKYSSACGADEVCRNNACISRCLIDPSYPC